MIVVWIEDQGGKVTDAVWEALTMGRRLAQQMGQPLAALLAGAPEASGLTDQLKEYGVSRVWLTGDERLARWAPQAQARVLARLIEQERPQVVLAAATDRGNELLAYLAARLQLGLATNCTEVHPGDDFTVTRLRWGGSLLEEARLLSEPKLLTVALHVNAPEPQPAESFQIEQFVAQLEERDFIIQMSKMEESAHEGVSLAEAKVVVGGGRGVGNAEGFKSLEELAQLLGGAVGGSRVATNNGWRPHADQIGQTGAQIAPELYIACGISGAIQHVVGCKGAKNILVINKDPEAPFFARADYGVVGDLREVIPALVEAIRRERGD